MAQSHRIASELGVILVAVFFNSLFCGIITKQNYLYWTGGFKDSIYVRALVVAQCSIVVLQTALNWRFAWVAFVSIYGHGRISKATTWTSPVSSACQCVLIVIANTFLAFRIYNLTSSRLKTGLVFLFSVVAFILGVISIAMSFISGRPTVEVAHPFERATAVIWHALQAIAEFLIMYFLSRALLASRSGIKGSDKVVHHLVRNVIQIGLFAMLWAVIGLSTYFLLPQFAIYSIFDTTSGSIYTHMIYDGLLSRGRLRGRMAELSRDVPSQGVYLPTSSRGMGSSNSPQESGAISLVNLASKDNTSY
ncbi:hypothetical protein BGW80DRAFT_1345862 [Lactifluus volemus]|nr:hypothetical protein BGW80DRAFT_1381413 [Lactifluus volemus]KAH9965149.1 hypothetical protein BGW80DRAFT_1345862 [Lactifluus volemus]